MTHPIHLLHFLQDLGLSLAQFFPAALDPKLPIQNKNCVSFRRSSALYDLGPFASFCHLSRWQGPPKSGPKWRPRLVVKGLDGAGHIWQLVLPLDGGALAKSSKSWLVVDLPLWKMMEFVSWDYDIPNIWKNQTCSKPPTRNFNFPSKTY